MNLLVRSIRSLILTLLTKHNNLTMQNSAPIFHLALPITDIEAAREFYGKVLGLKEKRSAFNWIDFDFWGIS